MRSDVVLSPRAQQDLDDIWQYTKERWGASQAEFYLREIWQHVKFIADHPSLGRSCNHIREGYYQYPAAAHMLFFRKTGKGIDIIRILHQRMDMEHHL